MNECIIYYCTITISTDDLNICFYNFIFWVFLCDEARKGSIKLFYPALTIILKPCSLPCDAAARALSPQPMHQSYARLRNFPEGALHKFSIEWINEKG